MTQDLIIILVSAGATLLTGALSTVLGIIAKKYGVEKTIATNATNYLDIINKIMPDLIVKYEDIFKHGNGEKKLTLVLNELTAYCIENNISYDKDVLQEAVENYVSLSKEINKR